MNIKSEIQVGNDAELNINKIAIETSCLGFVTLDIPKEVGGKKLELSRRDLREYLARTTPEFITEEFYSAIKK